jgi:hypothetical protein
MEMRLDDYCTNRWPELWQFFGGYFHEDFMDDYGSPEGAIDAFLSNTNPEYVQKVLNQLEDYLAFSREYLSKHPEKDDWYPVESMGVHYLPSADGFTAIGWLEHVLERFREYLARTQGQRQ